MPERKWQPNFIENGMLVSKNPKDGKFDDLKSLKNQKLENHFKTGLEIIILKSKGKCLRGVAHGSKGGHVRGGHAHGPEVQMIFHLEVGDRSRHLLLSEILMILSSNRR